MQANMIYCASMYRTTSTWKHSSLKVGGPIEISKYIVQYAILYVELEPFNFGDSYLLR